MIDGLRQKNPPGGNMLPLLGRVSDLRIAAVFSVSHLHCSGRGPLFLLLIQVNFVADQVDRLAQARAG